MYSPTQLTLKQLRLNEYKAFVVEHWNQFTKTRHDLLGVIDVLALKPEETLGVQATTVPNQAARIKKILGHENTRTWLAAGNRLEVWGWKKKDRIWQCTKTQIRMFENNLLPIRLEG
jgi:hypothetical protein